MKNITLAIGLFLFGFSNVSHAAGSRELWEILREMHIQGLQSNVELVNVAAGHLVMCLPTKTPSEKVKLYKSMLHEGFRQGFTDSTNISPAFAILACRAGSRTPSKMVKAFSVKYYDVVRDGFNNILSNAHMTALLMEEEAPAVVARAPQSNRSTSGRPAPRRRPAPRP